MIRIRLPLRVVHSRVEQNHSLTYVNGQRIAKMSKKNAELLKGLTDDLLLLVSFIWDDLDETHPEDIVNACRRAQSMCK